MRSIPVNTTSTSTTARSAAYLAIRRIFDEGFSTGDDAVVDEVCSPDLVEHQFATAGVGAEAIEHVKAAIRDVHGAFPDMTFTIEDSVESGDTIWVRVRGRGTGAGPFFGPPSGNPVDITVIDVARVVDGRIVEHWGVPDRLGAMLQIGAMPPTVPPAPSGAGVSPRAGR
jgi:predicted ester cyclase